MTDTADSLLHLATRVEALDAPSREVDARIHCEINGYIFRSIKSGGYLHDWPLRRITNSIGFEWPAFTASMDAATALISPEFRRRHPLWTLRTETRSHGQHGASHTAELCIPSREFQGHSRVNLACAVTAAALRAVAMEAEGG